MNKKDIKSRPEFAKYCTVAGIVTACLVLAGALYLWLKPGEAPDQKVISEMSREAKTRYLASDDFGKLDDNKKSQVVKELGKGANRREMFRSAQNLSDEDRRKMRDNMKPVMKKMMQEHLDRFFKMTKEERAAEIDKMIDRMEQGRKMREAAGGNNQGGGRRGGPGGRNLEAGMSMILEESDSDTRAKMTEFFKQIRARRKQRGMN